jgi:hypothetical protein
MEWISANKEWLFSGILVAIPLAIIGWLFVKHQIKLSQRQKAGDNSINVQAGRDVVIKTGTQVDKAKTRKRR